MTTTAVSISDAKGRLTALVRDADTEPVTLTRRGHRAAMLISPQLYDRMVEALEDAEDQAAIDAYNANPGPTRPFAEVLAELDK